MNKCRSDKITGTRSLIIRIKLISRIFKVFSGSHPCYFRGQKLLPARFNFMFQVRIIAMNHIINQLHMI